MEEILGGIEVQGILDAAYLGHEAIGAYLDVLKAAVKPSGPDCAIASFAKPTKADLLAFKFYGIGVPDVMGAYKTLARMMQPGVDLTPFDSLTDDEAASILHQAYTDPVSYSRTKTPLPPPDWALLEADMRTDFAKKIYAAAEPYIREKYERHMFATHENTRPVPPEYVKTFSGESGVDIAETLGYNPRTGLFNKVSPIHSLSVVIHAYTSIVAHSCP